MEAVNCNNLVSHLRRCCMAKDTVTNHIQETMKFKFIDSCPQWKVCKTSSRFNRRVTAIEWHPVYPNMVTYASHGGDVLLLDTSTNTDRGFIEGEGFGYGCITELAYDHTDPMQVFCSSINGTITKRDFNGKKSVVLIDTMDINYWWTSLVYCNTRRLLFTGGNTGRAVLMDRDGNKIKEYSKLHKGKIHHSELSPVNENILVTSSNDRTVALWDMRYLTEEKPHPLAVMKHSAPVNSAYFDPVLGSRILTTAQNSELRLYESHDLWAEPTLIIQHPHRHFQHMTNIKATWHPLYNDLCVIGRYPASEDKDQSRCVDIIDLNEGAGSGDHVVGQFIDYSVSQIMVVNKFNIAGNILATGMGYTGILWKLDSECAQLMTSGNRKKGVVGVNGGLGVGRGRGRGSNSNRRTSRKRNEKRKIPLELEQTRCSKKKRNL